MKRRQPEDVIVHYFMTAPPDAAFTLLGVARSLVAARGITSAASWTASATPPGPRAGRRNGKRPTVDETRLQPAQDATTGH